MMFNTVPTDPWQHWNQQQRADASSRRPFVDRTGSSSQTSQPFSAAAFASTLGSAQPQAPQQADAGTSSVPTSAFNLLGKQAPPLSTAPPPGRQSPDQLVANALNQALTGEKRSIPTWNGSPSTLRSWLKLLAIWEYESTVPMDKRGIKLLQSFPDGSQPRHIADTVPVEVLLSPQGYGEILSAIHQKYAPFLEASAPQAIDHFLFEGERSKGESFSAFIATKQLQRQEMEAQMGERVSDKLCGRILLRQANLNELQREKVTLRGPALRTFDEVANMLRPLDRPEILARTTEAGSTSKAYAVFDNMPPEYDIAEQDEAPEVEEEYFEEWSADEDEEGFPLVYFEDREHDEMEAMEIMAYHSAYRDVRRELQKRRNERGAVRRDKGGKHGGKGSFGVRKGKGKTKGKRSRKGSANRGNKGYEEDLEQRTRCWNCQELGHFSKNCPLTRGASGNHNSVSRRPQQFVVSNGQASMNLGTVQQYMQYSVRPLPSHTPQIFMHEQAVTRLSIYTGVVCQPGQALVDTAAEEAVIGSSALRALQQELRKFGLRTIPVDSHHPRPSAGGIGGAAIVESMVEIPIGVAQINGVVRFTVLKDSPTCSTPPLLPISFLETIEATIDTRRDLLIAGNGNTAKMHRLPTRHRSTSILDFSDGKWSLPISYRKNPSVDPFEIPHQEPVRQSSSFWMQPNNCISIWLLHQDALVHVQDVDSQHELLLPHQCPLLREFAHELEPERLTYICHPPGRSSHGHS